MIVKTLLAAILFLNAVSLVVAQQNTGALKAHHVQRTRVQHKSHLPNQSCNGLTHWRSQLMPPTSSTEQTKDYQLET